MIKVRGRGYKLFLGEFLLEESREFSSMRTVSHWEVVDSLALDTFTVHLNKVLKHLI